MSATQHVIHRNLRLPRRVLPELLDELPADDPRAVRSRQDLRRVNRLLNARPLLTRALDTVAPMHRLLELGAGDGSMMLRLAQSRTQQWQPSAVSLLDLQPVVSAETLSAIRDLGWPVDVVEADVLDWLEQWTFGHDTVMFANLFVHHFQGDRLTRLLARIAARCRAFVCCEPRRSNMALVGSHLLTMIGCSEVTRHDAVRSVHAGFRDQELSTTWRAACAGNWQIEEHAAGLFSHLFIAVRK